MSCFSRGAVVALVAVLTVAAKGPAKTPHAVAVPAGGGAKNVLAGCQILPNNHIFNTRIDDLPVSSNSAAFMARIPNSAVGYYPAWGTNIADSSTPKEKMHFAYTPQNDGVYEIPAWPKLKRENGVFTTPSSGEDRHVLTVDRETCRVYELYNNYSAGMNKSCPTCTAQSGVQYAGMEASLPSGSVDAAGLLLAPLTLRMDEVRSGSIQHALRVTLSNSIISPSSVWPSRAHAGAWGKIPYGTRFRLKKSYDISKFSPFAQVLLTQLKEYGLIVADGGANWEVDISTDVTEDPRVMAALYEVGGRGPRSSDFEVVDESSLMASPASGTIKAGATRTSIGVQAVTVGVPDPALWIQSNLSKHLTAWVNGTANKGLKWSISPALGRLTSNGEYTAPDVAAPTYAIVTAASVSNPEAKATIGLTVLPKGPIRIDVGDATRAPSAPRKFAPNYGPDSEGHMWWRDQGGEFGWGVVTDTAGGPWGPDGKDVGLYYTSRYSFDDMVYRFTVPNGNYKITLLIAQTDCPWKSKFDPKNMRPIKLEAQGQIVADNFDWGRPIEYTCRVPTSVEIPAKVTDGNLYFALRRVATGKTKGIPLLNAFSIEPDTSAPHISIDPAGPITATMGQTVQFNAVAWYTSNSVTWSLLKGPGSISPKGLYQAPSSPPKSGDETAIIEAKSTSDPKLTAKAQLTFGFGALTVSPGSISLARSLSQKFTASINGTPDTNVAWSISPGVGEITPDGVYTAPDSLAHDTDVTVKAQSKDDPSKSATAALALKSAPQAIRINCGDTGGFKDAQGNVWDSDHGFQGSSLANNASKPIAGAPPDMQRLYQSSRYCYADQRFNYTFPVPNGRYAVTLKFADYSWNDPGHYQFDVLINGTKVLSNFDLQVGYPPKTAIDKRYETTVTNKAIRIDFVAHKAAAIINGIEIVYLGP
ncbi:MAG TPA: malectin domain-containing carbohydrate-binding protein [Bryobacteraceae bacterium]|nr:malectin domain-containing carbohydrate-binding protein [Bryobacteraceae bacterium]